jgi:hypothetical protein
MADKMELRLGRVVTSDLQLTVLSPVCTAVTSATCLLLGFWHRGCRILAHFFSTSDQGQRFDLSGHDALYNRFKDVGVSLGLSGGGLAQCVVDSLCLEDERSERLERD